MDVRIGVTDSPKEIDIEMADDVDVDDLRAQLEGALTGESGTLWLTDRRGRQYGLAASKIAWVQIGSASDDRRIGFGG